MDRTGHPSTLYRAPWAKWGRRWTQSWGLKAGSQNWEPKLGTKAGNQNWEPKQGRGCARLASPPEMLPQMNLNLISIQSESDRIVMQVEI